MIVTEPVKERQSAIPKQRSILEAVSQRPPPHAVWASTWRRYWTPSAVLLPSLCLQHPPRPPALSSCPCVLWLHLIISGAAAIQMSLPRFRRGRLWRATRRGMLGTRLRRKIWAVHVWRCNVASISASEWANVAARDLCVRSQSMVSLRIAATTDRRQ